VIDEENQETRESPALQPDEVSFSREDAESVGDPAAAGTGAEGDPGSAPVEAPGAADTAATATTGEPPQDSPAGAQARAESGDGSPLERPEVQILGAFVGAFVLAKLLQRLFSRD
jgi:hypothetical protein